LVFVKLSLIESGFVGQVFVPPGRKHGCQSGENSMIRRVSASAASASW
jgi:hypothetical protein